MNPLNWTAQPFLTFYLQVATLALVLIAVLRWRIGRGRTGDAAGLDVVQIAWLAGGPKRAADTALVGLLEYGAVVRTSTGLAKDSLGRPRATSVGPDRHRPSAAARWRALRGFVAWERGVGLRAARRPHTAFLHEFVRFGVKQAWACLFGGAMLALLLATHRWYPPGAALARYDFLTLAAIAIQAAMLATGLETREEARVILLFHLAGTAMELFKTAAGSWIYPEPSVLRLGGVPLFTGFMYAAVGSYGARAWRVFDVRFVRHPPMAAVLALAAAVYVNFFAHHWLPDARLLLFATSAVLFARTQARYRIWRRERTMPLLPGFVLVALFIWVAENIGTYAQAWRYPNQAAGWAPVSLGKLGSWYLLILVSYVLVALANGAGPAAQRQGVAPGTAD